NRRVALKVPHQFMDEHTRKRFIREGETLAKLSHPNVVRVYDAGIEYEMVFMAMELIEGETLEQRMMGNTPSLNQIIHWGTELADALHYIHSQQVIHRDIKDQNIIINNQNHPVLVDFGLARNDTMTQITINDRAFLGTFIYASPESFEGKPITPQSDIYSLGVVLYKCVTDAFPYDGKSPREFISTLFQTTHIPAHEVNPDIPLWLSDILDRCLAKDPARRLQSGEALRDALREGMNTRHIPGDVAQNIQANAHPLPNLEAAPNTSTTQSSKQNLPLKPRTILMSIAVIALVTAGLLAYSSNLFVGRNTTGSNATESSAATIPPIDSLMQANSVDTLEDLLKQYQRKAILTYDNSTEGFTNPGDCYVIAYNASGVVTILSPEDSKGLRTNLKTQIPVSGAFEDSFPEAALLWVLLL
ncbi:MAG: serine/threonine protein kinase, partial [Rhodothermaceae bacterium]|nr:serine/threonine protein kinase [Rhodothermaceae bacterium]